MGCRPSQLTNSYFSRRLLHHQPVKFAHTRTRSAVGFSRTPTMSKVLRRCLGLGPPDIFSTWQAGNSTKYEGLNGKNIYKWWMLHVQKFTQTCWMCYDVLKSLVLHNHEVLRLVEELLRVKTHWIPRFSLQNSWFVMGLILKKWCMEEVSNQFTSSESESRIPKGWYVPGTARCCLSSFPVLVPKPWLLCEAKAYLDKHYGVCEA